MIANQEALWVKVLHAKYNCGGLMIPKMQSGARTSHLWRVIVGSWDMVERSISWVVRNGQGVRFWQDSWMPGLGPLSDHASSVPDHEWDYTVSSYVLNENWD